VRFSRALDGTSPELKQAQQLAEYGSNLAQQYQYAGDPPFEEFYPAHVQYFKALSGDAAALDYFREKLGPDVQDSDNQLAALGFLELLMRLDRIDEAVEVAAKYLTGVQEQFGFSFADLCRKAGRYDLLLKLAREKDDLITYTAALLHEGAQPISA
jgi:hypothetical protein